MIMMYLMVADINECNATGTVSCQVIFTNTPGVVINGGSQGSLLSKILGPQESINPTNTPGVVSNGGSQGSQESADMTSLLAGVLGVVGGVIIVSVVAIAVVIAFIKVRKRKKEQNGNRHQETRYE